MSTFTDNVDVLLLDEGPNGEAPPDPNPPPLFDEWIMQYLIVLWHLATYLAWKSGHPVPQPNLAEEPYAEWETMYPDFEPREMAAAGHIALYP